MIRTLIILLGCCAGLGFGAGGVAVANQPEPAVQKLGKSEFAFDLGDSRITASIRDPVLRKKQAILLDWILYSSKAVVDYYGRFPVRTVRIDLQVAGGHAVRFGQAFGGDSPHLRIVVGENVTPEMLKRDWILVHEMVHLAMADVPPKHRWLLEGLATYVESIARARQGHLSEEFVWNGFINRMPQGLPQANDRGLDLTPTWGRTYWGGAIFCMLADIEIRRLTNNRKSLRDALRGVLDAGFSMHASASVTDIFAAGDRATGVDVLLPLYQKMKADPYPVDLEALWQSLGVALDGDRVVYNDSAPMAHIRKSLFKT